MQGFYLDEFSTFCYELQMTLNAHAHYLDYLDLSNFSTAILLILHHQQWLVVSFIWRYTQQAGAKHAIILTDLQWTVNKKYILYSKDLMVIHTCVMNVQHTYIHNNIILTDAILEMHVKA